MGDTSPQPRTRNQDLALLLGEIMGEVKSIKQTTDKLDHSINGNGKPGLVTDHRELAGKVEKLNDKLCDHLEDHDILTKLAIEEKAAEKKAVADKKERWSARTWAVVLAILGAFITNSIGLIFLYIRFGTIAK
jgi:hypothetical protein